MTGRIRRYTVATLVLSVCAVPVAADKVSIHGLVVDKQSARPLPGALVSVSGGLGRCDVLTDEEGSFFLPLVDAVKPGQLIRLRAEGDGYKPSDVQVPASNESVTTIKLLRVAGVAARQPRPVIEQVVVLANKDDSDRTIEVQVANRSNKPVWLQRLQIRADYVLSTGGMTGFLSRVSYDVSVEAASAGKIVGKAEPVEIAGPGYDATGFFRYTFSSEERSWRGGISANCPLRIDALDKVLIRLNLKNPKRVLRQTEEEGTFLSAVITDVKRDALEVRLVTDDAQVISWTGKDAKVLLEWLSEAPKTESK